MYFFAKVCRTKQGKLRTKRYLKQHCTLNVICSGINKYHSFSDIIDMAFNGQGCRLCCPNQPTGGAVSLNGCHNHRPEGPILKRSQIQGHTLGDYSLTNQATNLKIQKNSKINAFKFRFFVKISLFCFTFLKSKQLKRTISAIYEKITYHTTNIRHIKNLVNLELGVSLFEFFTNFYSDPRRKQVQESLDFRQAGTGNATDDENGDNILFGGVGDSIDDIITRFDYQGNFLGARIQQKFLQIFHGVEKFCFRSHIHFGHNDKKRNFQSYKVVKNINISLRSPGIFPF